jgi:putative phage-type endonuclease
MEDKTNMTRTISHPTRPFDIIVAEQRSPEWFAARLGRVTGSKAGAVWNKTAKGLRTAGWKQYQDQLVAEHLTGTSNDDVFMSNDMQRGIDLEPTARRATARRLGIQIRETGFLRHKHLLAGASLDGDVDDFKTVVEIKCPKTTTHLGYIEDQGLPDTYMGQILHNLLVSQAERILFVSFDDRVTPNLQLCIVERYAKDLPLQEYANDLALFHREMDDRLAHLSTIETLPVFH